MSVKPWDPSELEGLGDPGPMPPHHIDAADLATMEIPPEVGYSNPDDDMKLDADDDLLDGRMAVEYFSMLRTLDQVVAHYQGRKLQLNELAVFVREAWKKQKLDGVIPDADLYPLITEALRKAGIARLGGRLLSKISTAPAPAPLLGKLDPEGPTVLFGEGGCGKGVLASSWIVGLVGLGHRVLLVDYEGHPGEWARRVGSLGGADVSQAVMYVTPAGASWDGTRGPLWAQADELRMLATEHGATYVVVDSAVPACGSTDPLKPEAASQYAMGLERIGLPSLTIAHATKAGDLRYPFGSVFWHNLARVTFSLAKDGEMVVLTNRKANAYEWLGRFAVTFTWYEGILGEVGERSYSLALADRIAEVLVDGPLTLTELASELGAEGEAIKKESVQRTLTRDKERFIREGEKWSVRP